MNHNSEKRVLNEPSEIIKKVEKIDNALSNILVYEKRSGLILSHIHDELWLLLQSISGNEWIKVFQVRALIFQQRFSSATSKDFAQEQRVLCDLIMNQVLLSNPIHKAVFYHLKRYRTFLDTICDDFEENVSSEGGNDMNKIPFLMNATEVAALIALMKDCGFIAPVTDYRLGRIIEQTCLYDFQKPMKVASKVISKHRCMELNTEETLEKLKKQLVKSSIKKSATNEI